MNVGSSTSVIITTLPSAGEITSRSPRSPTSLRVAEEIRDPERDERQREREQPERPRAASERDAECSDRDERRDGDEAQSFARKIHDSSVTIELARR